MYADTINVACLSDADNYGTSVDALPPGSAIYFYCVLYMLWGSMFDDLE